VRVTLVLTAADIEPLLASLLPLQVRLPGEGERTLEVGPARSFALIPGVGLRVDTSARVQWEALGIGIPITLRAVTAVLSPRVDPADRSLVFDVRLENADFAGVPGFADHVIAGRINDALSRARLAWSFGKTLGRPLPLPATMTPTSRVELGPSGGQVTVSSDALSFAVDFAPTVARDRT
jgi:hypothetical protein